YVCFRVTDYRPDSYPDLLIDGEDLEHDLCLLMDALARSTPAVPVETVSEPVLTIEQVSERFNVSTKTISRWRERGLVGRRGGGRPAGGVQRPAAGGLRAVGGGPLPGAQQGAGRAERPVLAAFRRRARGHPPPGQAAGAGRRRHAHRGEPAHRPAVGPVAGDD